MENKAPIVKRARTIWITSEHRRLTLEALEDVDAGRVVDHQTVLAWADSLSSEKSLSPPR